MQTQKDDVQNEPGLEEGQTTTGRAWLVLGVLSVGVVLAALDLTVVVAILTSVMDALDVTLNNIDQGAWIVSAYLLAYTVTMPLMGRVSDVYGRRSVFLIALLVFVAGSILGGLADTLPLMIAARSIQAFGGGAMVPVSMAVIGDMFPPNKRGMALGIIGAADTAGWVIGPLYGSFMLKFVDWRWIFWINVPLGLLSAVIIFFALRSTSKKPAFTKTTPGRKIDYLGFMLLSISLTCLSLALGGGKETTVVGGASLDSIDQNPLKDLQSPMLVGSLVALILFIIVELKVKQPLINLRTFLRIPYTAANLANLVIGVMLIIGLVGVALFVNAVDNSNLAADIAFHSSLALAPLTLGMALGAVGGGWLSDWLGYRVATISGLLLVSAGFLIMNRWSVHWRMPEQLPDLFPGAGLAGIGFGLVIAPVGSAVIDWAEREDIGVAAALVLILRLIGMTVGMSTYTTWALNRYNQIKPADFDFTTVSSDQLREPLAQVVTEAFFAAAILGVLTIIPAMLLKRRGSGTGDERREMGRLL